jgi:hypothetical protein
MTRNARLRREYEKARNWDGGSGKQSFEPGFQVSEAEAFQRILPKNIGPKKLKAWINLVRGL